MTDKMNWPSSAPKPKKGDSILINFVLDKSGSMQVVRAATIDGFNEFLTAQRAEGGEASLTLTMFDTAFYEVCRGVPLREVPEMDAGNYVPDGCTALYDAIAHTIRIADDHVKKLRKKPDQVLFVITTDGEENSSQEFDRTRIFQMIKDREQRGYEFVYLGANQDAYAEAHAVGVSPGNTRGWVHSDRGARELHRRLNEQVSAYRSAGVSHLAEAGLDWFEPDEHLNEDDEQGGAS